MAAVGRTFSPVFLRRGPPEANLRLLPSLYTDGEYLSRGGSDLASDTGCITEAPVGVLAVQSKGDRIVFSTVGAGPYMSDFHGGRVHQFN